MDPSKGTDLTAILYDKNNHEIGSGKVNSEGKATIHVSTPIPVGTVTAKVKSNETTEIDNYSDSSDAKEVTLEDSKVPIFTVGKQNPETGSVEITVVGEGNYNYPNGTKVTLPGVVGEKIINNGKVILTNNDLPVQKTTNKGTVTEENKLPKDGNEVEVPAKLVDSKNPTIEKVSQNPETGAVTYKVTDPDHGNYPEGATVTINGNNYPVTGGTVTVPNDKLPEAKTTETPKVQESGKLPKTANEVEVPAKLTSAKGEPAREFEVTIPLPIVVPDSEHLTPKEIEKLVDKVKESNPNTIVTADDKGNVTVTDKTTGESVLIPAKDLTVKDFELVKPNDKVPVKDKPHLTPEEKKQVADKVKEKNPGKEVTVGDDGTATVTDPATGISHTVPGSDLVNQDFTPVKPTDKVPVKNAQVLTPDEKDKVKDNVKAKNPGKEVTVGEDGTATVKDSNTGITHTIPGSDLVNQDFTPVKPTDKVPAKNAQGLTQDEKDKVKDNVKAKNPGKEVTVGADGTATVTDPTTGISHQIPGSDLVNQDFTPVKPTDKVPVKDLNNLSKDEQDKIKESVEKANPGKTVVVEATGKVTITDPNTNISHELSGEEVTSILPPVLELPEYTDPIGTTGVDENGNLILPPIVDRPQIIITKWTDEQGNELKPADAKAPAKIGEANEAYEHGEISGYVFVKTETEGEVVTHIFRKVRSHDTTSLHEDNNHEEQPSHPTQSINDTSEVTAPVEPTTEENHSTVKSHASQTVLPNTGTAGNAGIFSAAASMLAGLGFLIPFGKRRKKEDEEA